MSSSERVLSEICTHIVDCPHKTAPQTQQEPYAFAVGTKAISEDGSVDWSKCRPVSQQTYQNWITRLQPEEGDLILCREAPVGPLTRVPKTPRVCLGQRTVLLRPDAAVVDPQWLEYALRSPDSQRRLRVLSEGSTVPHLNVADIRTFRIPVPPLDEQRRIASVLGSIDDKIESNRRLARQLDACLGELYIAATRKVESRQPLSEVAAHHKASVQPSKTPQADYEHFSIPAFDSGALSEITQGADILSGKYTFPDDAVALSKLNPTTKRVLVRRSVTDLPAICSSEFVVLRPVNGMTTEVLYAVLAHDGLFYSEVLTGVTGTTGSRQRVNPAHVLQSTVPAFDPEQVSSLTDAIRPMHEQISTLHRETVRLRAIHEALLPKLVSGQIRVPAGVESIEAEVADLVESTA